MKKLFLIFFSLAVIFLALVFFPQPQAFAQNPPPAIPHSLDGRADCLACHQTGLAGAPKYPPDHAGRTNDMCQLCHKPGTIRVTTPGPTASPRAATTPGTTAGGPPRIPHPLQGRDDCLACHATGLGGSPKVPASHAGRTVATCRGCHQPATADVAPVVVPTAIPHTQVTTKNSCVDCHLKQSGKLADDVKAWQTSIHSERNVSCVDCHGGNASADNKVDAMSASAGYVGIPRAVDIPALCASCHARTEQMRQYDIPTDQYAKYLTSTHGQKLAQGDVNVATCFTCHDGHGTKKTNDPSSQVYVLNVPALCGSCHANTQLMKPYNIPTNQYSLYVQSVHGIALLQHQDLRAPSCATCHGTHGAAPPGFDEVANVCGSCHTATQNYFLKSVHASDAPGTPKCVTCHGRYDVGVPSEAMFSGTDARQCGSCHPPASAEAKSVQSISDAITASAKAVDDADAALKQAASSALIVAPEEVKLREARTNLITARAAQHTLDLTLVKEKTDKATQDAKEVIADAEKAQAANTDRSRVMIVGLAIMALAILSLWVIRREIYRQLPPKE